MTLAYAGTIHTERSGIVAQHLGLPTVDLAVIKQRVALENPELSGFELTEGEIEYRQHLARCKADPNASNFPTRKADKFWHAHILHTRLYHEFCEEYFGYYLHHTPKQVPAELMNADAEWCCNDC